MKDEEIFGILIRDLRKNKSISQEKLAEKTNLDRTFISLIETEKEFLHLHPFANSPKAWI